MTTNSGDTMPLDPISYSLIKSKSLSNSGDSVNIVYSATEPTDKDVIWFDLNHNRPRLYNTKSGHWGYLSYAEGYMDFDNNSDGFWTNYIRIPITTPPTESVQYKIEIDGNTVQIYANDGTTILTSADVGSYFWNSVQPDGSDIRVFDETSIQNYFWIETFDYTAQKMVIWVKIDAGQEQVNIAYGNNDCTDSRYNNGDMTFELFDDFNDGVVDTSKWIKVGDGTVKEENGYLEIIGPGDATHKLVYLFSSEQIKVPCIVETRFLIARSSIWYAYAHLYLLAQEQVIRPPNTYSTMVASKIAYHEPNNFRLYVVVDGEGTYTHIPIEQTVNTNTWYEWQTILKSDASHILRLDNSNPVIWNASKIWSSGYIAFQAFEGEHCKYDWIRVRKYIPHDLSFGTPTVEEF